MRFLEASASVSLCWGSFAPPGASSFALGGKGTKTPPNLRFGLPFFVLCGGSFCEKKPPNFSALPWQDWQNVILRLAGPPCRSPCRTAQSVRHAYTTRSAVTPAPCRWPGSLFKESCASEANPTIGTVGPGSGSSDLGGIGPGKSLGKWRLPGRSANQKSP